MLNFDTAEPITEALPVPELPNEKSQVPVSGVAPTQMPVSGVAPAQMPVSATHSPVGGVVAAFVAVALICSAGAWALYAFKNPHTRSGQLLIRV